MENVGGKAINPSTISWKKSNKYEICMYAVWEIIYILAFFFDNLFMNII